MQKENKEKLSAEQAVERVKEFINSPFELEEIGCIEENNWNEIEDNKKKYVNVIDMYDKWRQNRCMFLIDDPEKFFYQIRDKLGKKISGYAITDYYNWYELKVRNDSFKTYTGGYSVNYTVSYYVEVWVSYPDYCVSMRRKIEIFKVAIEAE
mgnify:CR=1 FL=1